MNDIIDVETEIIDESEEEVIDFTYSITSYGADYPVDSLIKRMTNNSICHTWISEKICLVNYTSI